MPITLGNTTITGLAANGLPANSVAATNMYSGAILQVVQTVKKDTWQGGGAATTFYTVTGLTANITPTYSTSRIMVKLSIVLGTQYWEVQGNLLRDGANIAASQGTVRGSRLPVSFCTAITDASGATGYDIFQGAFNYIDSPGTTSQVSYGVSLNGYSTYPIYVNRSYYDYDSYDYYECPISTITLLEIKA